MFLKAITFLLICTYLQTLVTWANGGRPGRPGGRQPLAHTPIRRKIICEHGRDTLRCRHGEILKIQYANYGRTSNRVCRKVWRSSRMCRRSRVSLRIVRSKCQNKRYCNLIASNNQFGDPCPGTHKYLEVHYFCRPKQGKLGVCGRWAFHYETQLCCSGKRWPRKAGFKCCGISIYSPNRQICCNNRPFFKNYGYDTKCCGSLAYNTLLQGCCRGKIYNKNIHCCDTGNILPLGHCGAKYCGVSPFNPTIQICCTSTGGISKVHYKIYGVDTACCGHNKIYNNITSKCCKNGMFVIGHNLPCQQNICGVRPFNPAYQICCGKHFIYNRHHFSECCGSKLYNVKTQRCCRPSLIVRNINTPCRQQCGSLLYHPSTHICCSNHFVRLKRFGNNTACCANVVYNSLTHKCCNNSVIVMRNLACTPCVTQYYDSTRFLCCEGTALRPKTSGKQTKCCGTLTFNSVTQRCCTQNVITTLPTTCNSLKCGGSPFNPSSQVCCFNRVLRQRRYGSNTGCCGPSVYNKVTHKCCNGHAVVLKSFSCAPCSGKYFNPSVQLCCDGVLLYRAYGSSASCCGKTQINTNTKKCCENGIAVLRVNSCPQPKCNGIPYDTATFICCDQKAVLKRTFGEVTGCCHYKGVYTVYHMQLQKCCFGSPLLASEPCPANRYLCTQDFDPAKHLCCNDKKVLRSYGANSACCGSEVMNKATEICCNQAPAPVIRGAPTSCCGQRSYNMDRAKCCPDKKVVPKCGTCDVTIIPPFTVLTTYYQTQPPSTAKRTTYGYHHKPWW